MIRMNWSIILMNYDKKRENNGRERNLGLADLSLEELKQYLTTFRTSFTQKMVTTSLTRSFEALYIMMP